MLYSFGKESVAAAEKVVRKQGKATKRAREPLGEQGEGGGDRVSD